MTDKKLTDAELETLFAEQRGHVPEPDAAFMARISADAAAAATHAHRATRSAETSGGGRLWSWLRQWGAMGGGLVAAGVAGIWIGFSGPANLPDPVLLVSALAPGEIGAAAELNALTEQGWFAGGAGFALEEDG